MECIVTVGLLGLVVYCSYEFGKVVGRRESLALGQNGRGT
jgi:hypothetical protein